MTLGLGTLMGPHIVKWYTDIYTNVYGVDTTYSDIILKFNSYLKQMVNNSGFEAFSNIILTIGIVLMLFYFFSDLAEKAATNQLSMLQTGKSVGMAILTLFILFHTKQIFIFLLTFIESLNEALTVSSSGYEDVSAFLSNDIVQLLLSRCVSDHFNIFTIIGYTLTALLLTLVSIASRVYITYYAATRIIQLFVYYIFAPIGVADIFENTPSGTINRDSSGFRYIRTIAAIMLQVVVITLTCQTFTLVSTQIHSGYFDDQGDSSLHVGVGVIDDYFLENKMKKSATYPLKNFQYTSHKATLMEIVDNVRNSVKNFLEKAAELIFPWLKDDDDEELVEEPTVEKLKDSEKVNITNVVNMKGEIVNSSEADKIRDNSNYRMTVETTEVFFDWCTGADGSKMILFIILMATKVLMVASSAKICNYLVGVDL